MAGLGTLYCYVHFMGNYPLIISLPICCVVFSHQMAVTATCITCTYAWDHSRCPLKLDKGIQKRPIDSTLRECSAVLKCELQLCDCIEKTGLNKKWILQMPSFAAVHIGRMEVLFRGNLSIVLHHIICSMQMQGSFWHMFCICNLLADN